MRIKIKNYIILILFFLILSSLAIAKDNYVTFGVMQLSTTETIPFAEYYRYSYEVNSSSVSYTGFKDEKPDLRQIFFREIFTLQEQKIHHYVLIMAGLDIG